MKEQVFILKEFNSFELEDIFECGQCFRWNKQQDGSYTGVFNKNVLNVKKEATKITFSGLCKEDIANTCIEYFDLNRDYTKIKEELSKIDEHLKKSIQYGKGIRILKQDLWEMIISFIISANNNIPRIKKIIENLSKTYGDEIVWNNQKYYTFPTIKQLSKASVEDLRKLGLGFRDKRIYETTKMFLEGQIKLEELEKEEDIDKLREKLLTLPGVGPKVADCIMLFGMQKYEVFPIDVWIRRVMNDLYIKNEDETKVSKSEIEQLARKKYGNLAGIAQQYLFFAARENSI